MTGWLCMLLAAASVPADETAQYRMQPMGWVFMLGSIGGVLALAGYCYYKVLTLPRANGNNNDALPERRP